MSTSFDAKTLGTVIAEALGLKPGMDVVIQRDLLNKNRVLVLRVADEQESKP